ncbi:hypothetical protein ACQ33O_01015 [Ferruginibacter sp. SUN002]|uniref:hypothetical protein n=1 Tax=Ferruginibacter sp. SUN002 TaxID=2937789 RepID=UPI003D36E5A9
MKGCISIVFLLQSVFTFAQKPEVIEEKLLANFKQINYWVDHHEYSDSIHSYDSIGKYNTLFTNDLLKYTTESPSTFKYKFEKLEKEGLTIVNSEDSMLKIYSWDTWEGGTMHFFSTIFQYRYGEKIYAKEMIYENDDPAGFYSELHTLKAGKKTYYLGINHSILSNREVYDEIKVFSIEGKKLNDKVKLIKTTTGLQNTVGFVFDFFSVANRPERPVKLIYYDKKKRTFKIPVVLENGVVTNKFITYLFTGKYFEKLKN